MTGAKVKLGVLKPIDLRAILNWAPIYNDLEPPEAGLTHNQVMILADHTRRLTSITDDRQCDDRTERRPAEMPAAQHPEIADHSEAVHQAHRDDDPVTGGD